MSLNVNEGLQVGLARDCGLIRLLMGHTLPVATSSRLRNLDAVFGLAIDWLV